MNTKSRPMMPKTFEVVKLIAAVNEPFHVRDLYAAADAHNPPLGHPTVTKTLAWLVAKRWVGPHDGKKRNPLESKKNYLYRRTVHFPKNVADCLVFKPKPSARPAAPLFKKGPMDLAWEALKQTFGTQRPVSADDLLPDCEVAA